MLAHLGNHGEMSSSSDEDASKFLRECIFHHFFIMIHLIQYQRSWSFGSFFWKVLEKATKSYALASSDKSCKSWAWKKTLLPSACYKAKENNTVHC